MYISSGIHSQKKTSIPADKTILLSLQFPKSIDGNIASARTNDSICHIKLTIKNNTDTLASFFENWNSWGFYNLSFELKKDDSTWFLTRAGGDWDKNFPSSIMLFPGDSLIFDYCLQQCTQQPWECFTHLPTRSLANAQIRAVYQLDEDTYKDYAAEVKEYGEMMLVMRAAHSKRFSRLSVDQKIQSFVREKIFSNEYCIKYIGSE